MKVNNQALNHCSKEVYENVLRYAYENAKIPPLLFEIPVDWFGEIFETTELESMVYRDTMLQIKRLELLDKIKNTSDKFIILPDIFGEQLFPISYYQDSQPDINSMRDYGVPNIVVINDHLFELIDEKLDGIKFCYAGKLYYFYDSTKEGAELFMSDTPTLKVIDVKKYTEFDFNEKYPIGVPIEGSYLMQIGMDNHILEAETDEDYLTLKIDYPHTIFDYNEASIINKSTIVGGFSTQHLDMFTQDKIVEVRADKFIMHQRNASFCETAVVIFKDNTYKIINDSFSVELNRLDKHTVEFYRNVNVKKVIMFYKPILMATNVKRVDSLYDDVMSISESGYYDLRRYAKNTTALYRWMVSSYPSLEEMVQYGYNHDIDVLRAIQITFPTMLRLDESYLTVSKKDANGNVSNTNQLFLTIPNNLLLRPMLFLDNVMFNFDTNNYSQQKLTTVHLNLQDYPDINTVLKTSLNPEEDIRAIFKTIDIDVALVSDIVSEGSLGNFKEYKNRLTHTPSTVVSKSEFEGNTNATYFVNGRASIGDEHDSLILKTPVYGIGMSSDLKVLLLTSKFRIPSVNFIKITHIEPFIELRYNATNEGLFCMEDKFSTAGYLAFNHNGLLANNDLQVITNNYATFNSGIKKYPDKETAGLRYIKLPRINGVYGIDLEIDTSLINTVTNVGSFNEKSIEVNPNILEYFKTGSNFEEVEYDLDLYDPDEIKNMADAVATFGSVNTRPYNMADYKIYLDTMNIKSVHNETLLPELEVIAKEFHPAILFHDIATKIYSNVYFSEMLAGKPYFEATFDNEFEFSLNKQMDYHVSDGPVIGGDIKLILLDKDKEMIMTPEFLNPPTYEPFRSIASNTINFNYAMDRQQIIDTPTVTLDIDKNE